MKRLLFLIVMALSTYVLSAQCPDGEVEVEFVIDTDAYGYETYWELTPEGDPCGTNTIASGGNPAVGCSGAGDQNQNPGGYANNSTYTEGPWCLTEGAQYHIHLVDDWGDGGGTFNVLVNGFNIFSFTGIGLGGTFTFTALEPQPYDLGVFGVNLYSYVPAGESDVIAEVFNAGMEQVDEFVLNYSVDGGTPFSSTILGTDLENFESMHAHHGLPLVLNEFGVYTIRIWTSDINGVEIDGNAVNDTLIQEIEVGPGIPNIIDDYVGTLVDMEQIAGPGDNVDRPTDLDFHPVLTNKELWVVNQETESEGGSTVTLYNAGESDQSSAFKQDGNAWHFMSLPTGMAFSQNGNWANSPGVFDANHNGGDAFTGPALWSSDMSVYAEPSGGNGSHLDMLHESPKCQGIAAEVDNVFWVFDGWSSDIVRYDFKEDHGPGNDYHGDAVVRRYADDAVAMDPSEQVVSHLVIDRELQWLYAVDHGNGRVIRIDINTGTNDGGVPSYTNPEPLAEYSVITGYTQETVLTDLDSPAGIDVIEDRMIITEHETGEVLIYDISTLPAQLLQIIPTGMSSLQGVKIGPEGRLWFVDYDTDGVFVLTPGAVGLEETTIDFSLSPNPASEQVTIRTVESMEQLQLFDALGRVLKSVSANSTVEQLDVQDVPAGVYQLIVTTAGGRGVERLIID